jgi:hypothetical protein
MLSTPFSWQAAYSLSVMARDAPVRSGCSGPTPSQKICMPPPVPVDSTTGAGLPVDAANCSATAWV